MAALAATVDSVPGERPPQALSTQRAAQKRYYVYKKPQSKKLNAHMRARFPGRQVGRQRRHAGDGLAWCCCRSLCLNKVFFYRYQATWYRPFNWRRPGSGNVWLMRLQLDRLKPHLAC